jgi:precorrin-6B methylase 1
VATLALYSREHFDSLPNIQNLGIITENTAILLKEAIKIVEKSEFVAMGNIQLLKIKNASTEEINESKVLITEQFMNIQKVAYDICKISERIEL